MKVSKLKLQNLYSLNGEWEIDFTHPDYQDNKIFSIIESVGDHFSIVPNAVSLALFGKATPAAAPDKVIRDGAQKCLAEVEFNVNGKNYCARWSFDKSVDDTLEGVKPLRHVIIDLDEDKAFNLENREVPVKIADILGFDFKSIHKTLILPQGGFDRYLETSSDKSAELLEHLTGRSIYLDLAQKFTQRSKAEISGLEALKSRMENIKPLDPKVSEELNTKARQLEKKISREKRYKDESKDILAWQENVKTLKIQEKEINDLLDKLREKENANSDNVKNFQLREKALDFAAEYSELKKVKRQLADIEIEIKSKIDEEQAGLKKLKEFEKKFTNAEKILAETESNKKKSAKKIVKAKELDLEIASVDKSRATKESQLVSIVDRLDDLQINIQKTSKELLEKEDKLSSIVELLGDEDSSLEHDLLSWKMDLDALYEIKENILSKRSEIKNLDEELEVSKKEQNEISEQIEAKKKEYKKLENYAGSADSDSSITNESLADLRTKKKDLESKCKDLESLPVLISNLLNLHKKLEDSQSKKESYAVNIERFELKFSKLNDSKESQTKLVKSYEDKFSVYKKLSALEEHRANLKEDEACPLCGSLEHPYLKDMPELHDSDKELNEAKESLEEISEKLSSVTVNLEVNRKHLEEETKTIEDLVIEYDVAKDLCLHKQEILLLNPNSEFDEEYLKFIEKKVELANQALAILSKQVEAFEEKETANSDAGIKLNDIKHELYDINSSLEYEKKNATSIAKNKEKYQIEHDESIAKFVLKLNSLSSLLNKFDIEFDIEVDDFLDGKGVDINKIEEKLESKRVEYQEKIDSKDELVKEIEALKSDILHNKNAYNHRIEEKKKIEPEYQKLRRSCDRLKSKRDVFGTTNLDNEAKNMESLVVIAEKGLSKARDLMNGEKLNKEQNAGQIKALTANKSNYLVELGSLTNTILISIRQAGFMSFESFESAYNSEEDSSDIKSVKEDLDKEKIELEVRKRDVEVRLQIELEKQSTDKSFDELDQEMKTWDESIRKKQIQLNKLYKELDGQGGDSSAKLEHIKSKIKRLTKEISKWGDIDSIEKPLDDAKFCKNAQSLTLDVLVNFSNKYMKTFSSSYYITRAVDSSNPNEKFLSLEVADTLTKKKQSITSIPVEDRFLVSLSLSLSLATISRAKSKLSYAIVEEGFSNLDEDSLKVVLEKIKVLNKEDILIGFTSHIDSLMELFPCKIKIERSNSVASCGQLAGCGITGA